MKGENAVLLDVLRMTVIIALEFVGHVKMDTLVSDVRIHVQQGVMLQDVTRVQVHVTVATMVYMELTVTTHVKSVLAKTASKMVAA